jgi:pimeloyl-ACP methyl ester carboxylesterase
MPAIFANGLEHYYELKGRGQPFVFVHGAFVDNRMWDPQIEYFADDYKILRYDLRGHGKTGGTSTPAYSIDFFAEDLGAVLDALELDRIILCGLSLGGMIAQSFAVRNIHRLRGLILADTAVSVRLTLSDKFQRYILAPKWVMSAAIRWMSVNRFVNFSFKLAQWTRSADWFGRDHQTAAYVRKAMLNISTEEYLKIYAAIYDFDLQDLAKITLPTLILNGEYESKSVFRHTQEMLKLIPNSQARVIPGAGHTSNMENPEGFNAELDQYLASLPPVEN